MTIIRTSLTTTSVLQQLVPVVGTDFDGMTIGTHITRNFTCQISLARPTKTEEILLNEKNVKLDALRSYYVWRRSSLLLAMPLIFAGMIFGFIDLFQQWRSSDTKAARNGFGKLLILIQNIDSTVLFIGVVAGFVFWNQFTTSLRIVRITFLLSFVMPLIPALFPLEMTLNTETKAVFSNDKVSEADLFFTKLLISLSYMLTLLPVIISFPGGALRAALRIRWLLPESMLSGWILVVSAPFYSILLCITLIVVLQVAGNFVLFLGTLLVVAAPWIYVIRGRFYVHLWTEEKKQQALLTQRIVGILTLVGYVFIISFAFTGDVSGVGFVGDQNSSDPIYLLSYVQAFRILVETLGRLFVTTLMFCDVILRMNLENWQDFETSKLKDEVDIMERYHAFMEAFHEEKDTIKDGKQIEGGAQSGDISTKIRLSKVNPEGSQSHSEADPESTTGRSFDEVEA